MVKQVSQKQGPKKARKPRATKSRLPAEHSDHRGQQPVKVGRYTILLGGLQYIHQSEDLRTADILMPLTGGETLEMMGMTFGSRHQIEGTSERWPNLPPLEPGKQYDILAAPLVDFGGVPDNWENFLLEQVIPLLAAGKKVLAFCAGSHGRTGTLLASLIALLEPETTADPIAAARRRHCCHAVETTDQAKAVFALRGQLLPKRWQGAFRL